MIFDFKAYFFQRNTYQAHNVHVIIHLNISMYKYGASAKTR
jgi:hypothetical protein